jgi:hypothetical protein
LLGLIFNPEDGGDVIPETWIDFQRNTRRYILENDTLHKYRCNNLEFCYIVAFTCTWNYT